MDTQEQTALTYADLSGFIGTERYHRLSLIPGVVFTDGMAYVAEKAGAFWLMDTIAMAVRENRDDEFMVFDLAVDANESFTLRCSDGNDNVFKSIRGGYTDFPLKEFRCYAAEGAIGNRPVMVVMLPSEY